MSQFMPEKTEASSSATKSGPEAYLSPDERKALQRSLSFPEDLPPKFKSWLIDFIAVNIPQIPISQIIGLSTIESTIKTSVLQSVSGAMARATSNLSLSGLMTDIPGCTITYSPTATVNVLVSATFAFNLGVGAIVRGHLYVDGVEQTGRVRLPAVSPGNDHYGSQVWAVSLTAGSHTLKLRAIIEGGGASSVLATDTAFVVLPAAS